MAKEVASEVKDLDEADDTIAAVEKALGLNHFETPVLHIQEPSS